MSAALVDGGPFATIDVAGLAGELVASLRAHQRVMEGLSAAEWDEWSALDDQARCDWLEARTA